MKVEYDKATDTMTVILRDGVSVVDSDEDTPGIVFDYNASGELVALEILDASRRVTDTSRVEFSLAT